MIRRADDIKGLAAQLDAQPFSNIYALAALAGYPADDRFYRAYAAGPGALVLCGGTAYPFLPPGAPAEEAARFLQMQNARCAVGDEQMVRALAAYMPGACIETSRMLVLHGPAPSGTLRRGCAAGMRRRRSTACSAPVMAAFRIFRSIWTPRTSGATISAGGPPCANSTGGSSPRAPFCARRTGPRLSARSPVRRNTGAGAARAPWCARCTMRPGGRALCLLAGQALLPFYARLGFQDLCAMAQLRIE